MEIQLLSKHGLSLRQIAAEVGCAVNTVRRHLALEAVPKYARKVKRPTKVAAHVFYLRERQTAARPNWIPASVLHREIVERGYDGVRHLSRHPAIEGCALAKKNPSEPRRGVVVKLQNALKGSP